jgi:ferric-dicitrate binding protein FerR (iron transport regulator)
MQLLPTGASARIHLQAQVAIAMLAALFLFAATANAQTSAGTISAVSGSVEIFRGGKTIAAVAGAPVEVGDQLKTGAGANVAVMLSDNSRFELGESSQMTIDAHTVGGGAATTRLGLTMGTLRNWVARLASGNAANYEVHTPNAVGAARGTMYDMQYQDNVERKQFTGCKEFTDIAVYQDSVDVFNPTAKGNQHVIVHQGEQTTVPCALVPLAPGAIAAMAAEENGATAGLVGGTGVASTAGVVGGLEGAGVMTNNPNPPASPSQ